MNRYISLVWLLMNSETRSPKWVSLGSKLGVNKAGFLYGDDRGGTLLLSFAASRGFPPSLAHGPFCLQSQQSSVRFSHRSTGTSTSTSFPSTVRTSVITLNLPENSGWSPFNKAWHIHMLLELRYGSFGDRNSDFHSTSESGRFRITVGLGIISLFMGRTIRTVIS